MSNRQTPEQLFASPEPMLEWLRSKNPSDIVTHDILDNDACLAVNFMKDRGFINAEWFMVPEDLRGGSIFEGDSVPYSWLARVIETLPQEVDVTAQMAIDALERS